MPVNFSPALTIRSSTWTIWNAARTTRTGTCGTYQYESIDGIYRIWFYDGPELYTCVIWQGAVPDDIIAGGYSQAQNDADKAAFVTNYLPYANAPLDAGQLDPRLLRRFGNLTAVGTAEVLVCGRPYVEQSSQAQRSIQSTSVTDSNGAATGAREVRITYLDSNYVLKTEDVFTNGTTKVNTVATDIRFIERLEVIKGTAAVGAIQLMTGTTGGATEFCGIPAGTNEAFLAHHYVPAGLKALLINWGATTNLNANFKLLGRKYFGANLVDQIVDLENLTGPGIVTAGRANFDRSTKSPIVFGEKTYTRITAVPGVSGLIARAWFEILEVPL